jgi:hypothetical protein
MKRMLLIATLALAGCAKSPAELDTVDDASCRAAVTQRGDNYDACRARMADYRRTRAIAVSGR